MGGFADIGTYPPGYLLGLDVGGANVPSNTTTETSILNAALVNAAPPFIAVGDDLHLRSWGHAIFGGTGTLTFNVYCGATKIWGGAASGSYASGLERGYELDLWIHLLSATTVAVTGWVNPRGPSGGAGPDPLNASTDLLLPGSDSGDPITVTALPQNLDIKAVCSINTATTQVRSRGTRVRYYPKNY